MTSLTTDSSIDSFITRWAPSAGSEKANYQGFLMELCDLLGVPRPEPARADMRENAYVFERSVLFQHGDGTSSTGFIDLYRRGCFVLETKQGVEAEEEAQPLSAEENARRAARRKGHGVRGTGGWDTALTKARAQAKRYARALPQEKGRPPFVVVVDVGYCIELYSEFSRSGGTYVPFPDPRSHRLLLHDLRKPEVCDMLRQVWTATAMRHERQPWELSHESC